MNSTLQKITPRNIRQGIAGSVHSIGLQLLSWISLSRLMKSRDQDLGAQNQNLGAQGQGPRFWKIWKIRIIPRLLFLTKNIKSDNSLLQWKHYSLYF